MNAWQSTIDKDPWLFSGDLVPIYQLITDSTKKASMERAVTNYLNKALLKEYERLLFAATSKLPRSLGTVQVMYGSAHSMTTLRGNFRKNGPWQFIA